MGVLLGGKTLVRTRYVRSRKSRFLPPLPDRAHDLASPRACRQVYAETALLPYKLNSFQFWYYYDMARECRYLKQFQRAQILDIELTVSSKWGLGIGSMEWIKSSGKLSEHSLEFLPVLKRMHLIYELYEISDAKVESCVRLVRKPLNVLLAGRIIRLSFESRCPKTGEYEARYIHECNCFTSMY